MSKYPQIKVNLDAIKQNASVVNNKCNKYGIQVAGVVKFSDCDLKIAKAYSEGGCAQIAVSRAIHLKKIKTSLNNIKTLLLRSPMKSELELVAKYADLSLHSDKNILIDLNKTAEKLKLHTGIILMLDVGDLREGFESIEELIEVASFVENNLKNLKLMGIGTGFACLSGVLPSKESLDYLVLAKKKVEHEIGRELPILSAGSSINMIMLKDGINLMPKEVNHLRIGGFIANPFNMKVNRGVSFDGMREDTLTLFAEIIEIREKNSAPKNASSKNWAGQKMEFIDKGRRLRAILAIGSQDIGNSSNLTPIENDIEIVSGSSDHTIVDVSNSKRKFSTGDVLAFTPKYPAMLHAFSGKHVNIKYVCDKK
jgi:predicted amino acid racemase